jgi:hypothetical protein
LQFAKQKEKENQQKEKYTIPITNGTIIKDVFEFPKRLRDIKKELWSDMYVLLPELFKKSIEYHKYINNIFINYQCKITENLKERTYSKLQDYIDEAQERGLVFSKSQKISDEYMVAEFGFLDNGEPEEGDTPIETDIEGENLNSILPDDQITPIIEDVLKVNMILIYDPKQSFTEAKDERDVKYGFLVFYI